MYIRLCYNEIKIKKGGNEKMKVSRPFRIDVLLLERFDRINDALMVNGSEVIRQLMQKYVEEKEDELKVKVTDLIKTRYDAPINGEAYVVGKTENEKYFFAWGWEYPYDDEVPSFDIPDGENGIQYFNTEREALKEMKETLEDANLKDEDDE